jgi:hypothetical protein
MEGWSMSKGRGRGEAKRGCRYEPGLQGKVLLKGAKEKEEKKRKYVSRRGEKFIKDKARARRAV